VKKFNQVPTKKGVSQTPSVFQAILSFWEPKAQSTVVVHWGNLLLLARETVFWKNQ